MASHATSYILTGAAVATRNRDQLPFSFPAKPQSMTIYLRFVEHGSAILANTVLLHIGDSNTYCQIRTDTPGVSTYGFWMKSVETGLAAVRLGAVGVTINTGDFIELRAFLGTIASGTHGLGLSINGAAEQVATSTSRLLPTAWGAATLWFNSLSTATVGFIAIRNVIIRRGILTLDQCRVYAGV